MRINLYIIQEFLQGISICGAQVETPPHACTLEDVTLLSPGTVIRPELVYVVDEPECAACTENGHYILTAAAGESMNRLNKPLPGTWLLTDAQTPFALLTQVQEVFRTFRDWELQILRLVNDNASLKEIGQAAVPLLFNPLCLDTAGLRNVFICERQKPIEYRIFSPEEEGLYESDETIEAFRIDPEFKRSVEKTEPSIFPADIMGYRILYYNIRFHDTYVARIMALETDRPIRRGDYAILKMLGEFLGMAMRRQNLVYNGHPQHFEEQLLALIAGRPVDWEVLEQTVGRYGWNLKDPFFCVFMPIPEHDKAISTVSTLVFHLENAFPGSAVLTVGNDLVMIINLRLVRKGREAVLSSLIYLIRENLLTTGISTEFHNLRQLGDACRQAKAAWRLGMELDETKWCYRYEQFVLTDLMRILSGVYSAQSLYPAGLQRLMDYDEAHDTCLVQSLQAYLDNDMSIVKTIQSLYVQRATFLYRLRRIREISELDLGDSNTRLLLRIVLHMDDKAPLPT